ncbi:MAG TPA: hypothetical protein VEG38_12190 [Acidimicrobiia bacterium]|nr:hypothetical protein [Acidimicrobiia bacterium]
MRPSVASLSFASLHSSELIALRAAGGAGSPPPFPFWPAAGVAAYGGGAAAGR